MRPDDGCFKDAVAGDETLDFAADSTMTFPDFQSDDMEATARPHRLTETNGLGTAESNKPTPTHIFLGIERCKLGAPPQS